MLSEVFTATREAEACLIGAILIQGSYSNNPINEINNFLFPEDFLDHSQYDNRHSRIYKAMLSCKTPHQIDVALEMYRAKTLKPKDCSYMSYCISICPCSLVYFSYANAVLKYSESRSNKTHKRKYFGIELINASKG